MDQIELLLDRLQRIESAVTALADKQTIKEWYTTAEVAEITGKAEYTVREWCRQGRVRAEKARNGRGWIISYEELMSIRNYGPAPIPKHELNNVDYHRREERRHVASQAGLTNDDA